MIYLLICSFVLLMEFVSYYFVKTYQLCSYNLSSFWKNCLEFSFSVGDKNKIKLTKRLLRFEILYAIISFFLFFIVFLLINSGFLIIFDLIIIFLLIPVWISLTHIILFPIEKLIKWFYILKAKKKLEKKNIIKIGITGSYGKTSVKNILAHLLSTRYKVCQTPKNYNTEMGLTLTILNELDDHDVFIAEMGARKKKDIEKLAKIVKPSLGVLTPIGQCHLQSFKTINNIENTKFELAQNLCTNGQMFFCGGNDSCEKLYHRFGGNKKLIGKEGSFCYAKNILYSSKGSEFEIVLDGQVLKASTKLLGKMNVQNIVLASAVAKFLGVSNKDICTAIASLAPSPHRLEVIKTDFCTILDDSYNSNEDGFMQALEVLEMFDGRKIVVTPGMVELGTAQAEKNFQLGCKIADSCDYLIIMNDTNKNALLSGAISHNFKKENIYFAKNRHEQKELINLLSCKNCVILFENDLPDNYQ